MRDIQKISAYKSKEYDRKRLADNKAMKNYKMNFFGKNNTAIDEYTGKRIYQSKDIAKIKYGENANRHSAQVDHILSLKEGFEKTQYNYFVSDLQLNKILNETYNLAVTNSKINQSKGSKSNFEYARDNAVLDKKSANNMRQKQINAEKEFNKRVIKETVIDGIKIAGSGALQSAKYNGTYSLLENTTDLVCGEKCFEEAVMDICCNTLKISVEEACSDVVRVAAYGKVNRLIDKIDNNKTKEWLKNINNNKNLGIALAVGVSVGSLTSDLLNGKIDIEEYKDAIVDTGVSMGVFYQISALLAPHGIIVSAVTNFVLTKVIDSLVKSYDENKERERRIEHYRAIGKIAEQEGNKIENILNNAKNKYTEETEIALAYMKEGVINTDDSLYEKGLKKLCDCYKFNLPIQNGNQMKEFFESSSSTLCLGDTVELELVRKKI